MDDRGEFWTRGRTSRLTTLLNILYNALWFGGLAGVELFGTTSLGLRPNLSVLLFPVTVAVGLMVTTIVHEFGHCLAALAVGFRLVSLNFGPLTIHKRPNGVLDYQFEWTKFFSYGGYAGSVPVTDVHVRSNMILVILGGPMSNLLVGMLLWMVVLGAKGTAFEPIWDYAGLLGVFMVSACVMNLIPAGYSDGTMLYHLLLWTPEGKDLCRLIGAGKISGEADQTQVGGDFVREIELRKQAGEQMLAAGKRRGSTLGAGYLLLGVAQINAGEKNDAKQSLNQAIECLRTFAGDSANAVMEGDAWSKLHSLYVSDRRAEDAERAYEMAADAFHQAEGASPDHLPEIRAAAAELHSHAWNYTKAYEEAQAALALLKPGVKNLLKQARLLTIRGKCEFHLGMAGEGARTVMETVRQLTSDEVAGSDRVHAALNLGGMSLALWMSGRSEEASALLVDSARRLDELGHSDKAAAQRLQRSVILRRLGRETEAERALPELESVKGHARATFFSQRGELRLSAGRPDEAIVDFVEALRLEREAGHATEETAVASIEESIADAHFDEAGRLDEAEALARKVLEVFRNHRHPNASGALVTLALIGFRRESDREAAERNLEEGIRLIDESPLLEIANRARGLEAIARRLERHAQPIHARACRAAAESQWDRLPGATDARAAVLAS